MIYNANISIYKRGVVYDISCPYEHNVALCRYALCEMMPPVNKDDDCCYYKTGMCINIGYKIDTLKFAVSKLKKDIKELETEGSYD